MPLPAVGAHVAKAGGDATLRGDGVGPGRKDLGHAGGAQPLFGHAERRAQPGATGTDNHNVIFMNFIRISSHRHSSEREPDQRKKPGGHQRVGQADGAHDQRLARQPVCIVLDHHLRTVSEMGQPHDQRQPRDDRREGAAIIGDDLFIGRAQDATEGEDEGLRGMKTGEIREMIIPPALSKRQSYPPNLSPDSIIVVKVILEKIL